MKSRIKILILIVFIVLVSNSLYSSDLPTGIPIAVYFLSV